MGQPSAPAMTLAHFYAATMPKPRPLVVHYCRDCRREEFRLDGWVPTTRAGFLPVITKPQVDLEIYVRSANRECVMPVAGFQCNEWQGNRFAIASPYGITADLSAWGSDSASSGALYPWVWNLADDFSNQPGCIVLQVMPPNSVTSEHFHPDSKLGDVAEIFAPLDRDPGTVLRRDHTAPTPLTEVTPVDINVAHQLIREADGFSLQLLRMFTPVEFACRELHIARAVA